MFSNRKGKTEIYFLNINIQFYMVKFVQSHFKACVVCLAPQGDFKIGGNADVKFSVGSYYVIKIRSCDCRHDSDSDGIRDEEELSAMRVFSFYIGRI